MKALIFVMACLCSVACFGQTKLISHRSHSGSDATFRTAVEHDLFDSNASNFGYYVAHVVTVDSVILKDNNKIIVLRKTYDVVGGGPRTPHTNTTYLRDELTKANAADCFMANSADSLKAKLHKLYTTAKLDSAIFIGFDKKFKQKKG